MTNLTAPPPIGDRGAILLKHKRDLPKSTLLPVPAFDHDRLLPEVLRWWVLDNAGRTGAPIEYIAIAALCSLGSLLSPKVEFQPKRHDTGWTVRSNFWGLAVGMPSSKKSPGLSCGLSPLRKLEEDSAKRFKEDQKVTKRKSAAIKARHDVALAEYKSLLKQEAKEPHNLDMEGLLDAAEQKVSDTLDELNKQPTQRRFIINDATVEKLGELMKDWPGLLQYRDELRCRS
jgi:hypothetical protein